MVHNKLPPVVSSHADSFAIDECLVRVVSLVGGHLFDLSVAVRSDQIRLRGHETGKQRLTVAVGSRVDRRRQHVFAFQIDDVFGFVAQVCAVRSSTALGLSPP